MMSRLFSCMGNFVRRWQVTEMDNHMILEKIEQADMVLVGLGEDFDGDVFLRQDARYLCGCEKLKEAGLHWLKPAWNEFCVEKSGDTSLNLALERLGEILQGKNHFLVGVSTNRRIGDLGRAVMPCGSWQKKQCAAGGCGGGLSEMAEQDRAALWRFFGELYEGRLPKEYPLPGTCPACGAALVLNNVYAKEYDESGYLEQWSLYRKWLQGTLNHRLLVLELGVGMRFPSVVRWPFEKVAFFNQKAYFCRVHEKLYQLTKELSEKGCGISKNAIDWLVEL